MNLSEDTSSSKNTNTVKFAGTVANVAASAANPIVVGAGDLIGASDFASSIAKDQPTIDVLNTVGLEASAVGNHEFDAGWTDLKDRVMGPVDDAASATDADWDYLGANVYNKGTTTPAMQEYSVFDKGGVTVAVIGAVTQKPPRWSARTASARSSSVTRSPRSTASPASSATATPPTARPTSSSPASTRARRRAPAAARRAPTRRRSPRAASSPRWPLSTPAST
ncbi:hypothetical protein [Nocardioides sp. B-3]|uniref:hypothetical protein n=1 Tax=Nocardioides sp. B-3 TaxID=2895565 RepID=UPI0021536DCA|nr:hypothetical protein [Nocardioides sp. B-3]UUZ58748.1 hypothetical protein LP418_22000 [Nocardioides sp. B-3]